MSSSEPAGAGAGSDVVDVLVQLLDPDAASPAYAHPGDAGADLVSTVDVTIGPGERVKVPTGVAVAIPDGWVGLVHPRSGLALRHGVGMVNAPGTVDAGYRGELHVLLVNHDRTTPATIRRGDRVAQLVLQRVGRARFHVADLLPGSVRGDSGFGSTGGFGDGPGPSRTSSTTGTTDGAGPAPTAP